MKAHLVFYLFSIIISISIFSITGCDDKTVTIRSFNLSPKYQCWGDENSIFVTYNKYKTNTIDFVQCKISGTSVSRIIVSSIDKVQYHDDYEIRCFYCKTDTSLIFNYNYKLYKQKISSGDLQVLKDFENSAFLLKDISEDGTRFCMGSQIQGMIDLFLINYDGTGFINITNDEIDEADAMVSTQLGKVVYNGYGRIFTVNLDGTGKTDLSNHPPGQFNSHEAPKFSKDMTKIYFLYRDSTGLKRILYRMNIDGSEKEALTNDSLYVSNYFLTSSNNKLILEGTISHNESKFYELFIDPFSINTLSFCGLNYYEDFSLISNSAVIYKSFDNDLRDLYMCRNNNELIMIAPGVIE